MFNEEIINNKIIYTPFYKLSLNDIHNFIELIELSKNIHRNDLYIFNCNEEELDSINNKINDEQALGIEKNIIYENIINGMKFYKWESWNISRIIDDKDFINNKHELCPILIYFIHE